jgi:hypothetical protein
MINMDTLSYHYPTTLMDSDGYPTQEALDYIKNWTYENHVTGEYFGKQMYDELIEYIRSIYVYNDAINYEDGLLEIHTFGWSGNEDIIEELKKTDLWLLKFRCEQTGGHYYFQIEDKGFDWQVSKIKDISM